LAHEPHKTTDQIIWRHLALCTSDHCRQHHVRRCSLCCILNHSSLTDRRLKLWKTLFRLIAREFHGIHYLLPCIA